MTIFSLLESFFFLFLGISFILVLLMVYHFKKKMDMIEKKNETLQDICRVICEELDFVKSQTHPVKSQNIDPFYLNYHKVTPPDNVNNEFLPEISVSDLFKTILVSGGGGNSIPDPLDIHNYENEELDDVHSYEEDFECQDDDTTHSTVEEIDDFQQEEDFEEERVYVLKLDEQFLPSSEMYSESERRVEELKDDDIINTSEEEALTVEEQPNKEEAHTEEIHEDIPPLEESLEIEDDMESKMTATKASLQKLTLQMLRTMVIKEGICTDPSKLKKMELIQLVLDSQ